MMTPKARDPCRRRPHVATAAFDADNINFYFSINNNNSNGDHSFYHYHPSTYHSNSVCSLQKS